MLLMSISIDQYEICVYRSKIGLKLHYPDEADNPKRSPDLAPCDFCLFPNMKKCSAGKIFCSNKEVIAETEVYFRDLENFYFLEVLKKAAVGSWRRSVQSLKREHKAENK
ncbi:hypothetical protein LAZ67_15002401 [Cordylochernes scorpioides]|uniref:Uncharacterized protein n=1 Tax=Cordylochernes scorpioides TaxID=51811 RepID=A0ABY6L9J5_9ARAC|nr:hypothetical protein LAZ67_15002401 [Cordylochernes scorpioides]